MEKQKKVLILILTIGVFAILNTEMGVIGLLPSIAEHFQVSISTAGLTVSLFAIAIAVSGPTMPLLFSGMDRKKVMLLVLGVFAIEDGGWKLSSTSNNSWLSKIYLCQFAARHILGIRWDETGRRADSAHVAWLTDPRNGIWSWSDQMLAGFAKGSKYYPRGVTSILWLYE